MADSLLKLDGVSFAYRGGDALQDISFEIQTGEFVALLGENGAGKSTLARICNGLLKPTGGVVTVGGKDTRRVKTSEIARDVGFLFQNPDRMLCQNTVRGELMFGLEFSSVPPEQHAARCDEMLSVFSLDGERDPFGMSRSERQQVALASVLARRPKLLILDEPTTGLDYRECMTIMDIVSRQNAEGAALLMITHDMEIVADFARRVLVLSRGKLIGDGDMRGVMRDRALLSSASLLPAQIPDLAMRLGGAFGEAFTITDMVKTVATLKEEVRV
ncbi:MAG: energy-coupling factor ABC transporter ATP-binding protein [Oscillospiraceae bacterium]|jgi:energy-coupling factor transport system ATP-binding protein|nr:energy-coupling factor ABC transporter ATP-binding protein [Oscillospiraceae bacterium]